MTRNRHKSKIKSCVLINPPTSPAEQDSLDRRIIKALALALYRSLDSEEYESLIKTLKQNEKSNAV